MVLIEIAAILDESGISMVDSLIKLSDDEYSFVILEDNLTGIINTTKEEINIHQKIKNK